ncbi:MAG: RNA polymerase factor sigma-54 [Muribaculaceae bacterium]|nr:RNA polymerase factor sigma-54 [Muribaculaceae bacterium]
MAQQNKQITKQTGTLTQKQVQQQRLMRQLGSVVEQTNLEIEDYVRQELGDNPALEPSADDAGGDLNRTDEEGKLSRDTSEDITPNDDWEDSGQQLVRTRGGGLRASDSDFPPEPLIVNETSLIDYLMGQLEEQGLDPQERVIAEQVIGNIDDKGYLRRDAASIADDLAFDGVTLVDDGLEREVETADVTRVVKRVQQLDPPGIGATSVQECLLLQLARKDTAQARLAHKMLSDYFDDYASHNYGRIMTALHLTTEQMGELTREIRRLDPHPGSQLAPSSSTHSAQITPDFIIESAGDGFTITLVNSIPELQISESYQSLATADAATKARKAVRDDAKKKVDRASDLIELLKMRQQTLWRIINAIFTRQREYFASQGDETCLKPMILDDVAKDVGCHPSVISRANANKYVQMPWGTKPLKFFFSEAVGDASSKAIQETLRTLVAGEDHENPLNDKELCDLLAERGYTVARRTVAKYRDQLHLPSAQQRKKRYQHP